VTRVSLPGELFLDAIVVDPARQLDFLLRGFGDGDFARLGSWDDRTIERARKRGRSVALRWVLNPALGIPITPWTVWRRPAFARDPAVPIAGWRRSGDTFVWDGVSEMLRIELDLSGPATVTGLHRADLQPVQTVSGAAGTTVVLDAGPMLGVRADNPAAIAAARGQSLVLLANGDGWTPFEIVGLPLDPQLAGTTYYDAGQQGEVGALTDPAAAAKNRLATGGPVVGWAPLAGLDPWAGPDPGALIDELTADVLPDLVSVMAANPPPLVGQQLTAEATHALESVRQVIGSRSRVLNGGGVGDRSEIRVRPLQALAAAVASDAWASLALGFGTGDAIATGDVAQKGGFDYMVSAKWDGLLTVAVPALWPWPWGAPPPQLVTQEVERELAGVVLAPQFRSAPGAPTPLVASFGHDEGADDVDEPYRVSAVVRTARPPTLPREPRVAAYALARYDAPGSGAYQMREHRLAGGWVPIGSAAPVANPGDAADPNVPPDTVTLRNGGLPRPVSGPPNTFQYAAAASDLFGQWSPWSGAWYSVGAANVEAPAVAALRAGAVAGPGDSDPCALTVSADVVWDIRERSLHQLHVAIDVYPPTPPPPAPYDEPPDQPQGGGVTVADLVIGFAPDGTPSGAPAGVGVTEVHDDDTPVTPADPAVGDERRYRIVVSDLGVPFGANHELAVAFYAQAEETVRPGDWSGWAHTREAAIAANPLPPPVPAPLPLVFPDWASLPDAAGLSYASVSWTPTGAWRYRVYEATEAALRAACGQPGPTLTDGFAGRMQALFDLYKDAANLPKLKAAFRKLGDEPVLPALEADGRMRYEAGLPRGSSLIHCFVVAGVSEANVVSGWPAPDADGRKAFHAFAIPQPRRPALPEISASLDAAGVPQVTVRIDGAIVATSIRLYRAANAILARSVGTMTLVATVPAGDGTPGSWKTTTIPDPGAPSSWSRLQYRAVALTDDDPDRAGIAVPSEPSRAYALLKPPPSPPAVTLSANVAGTTPAVSLVRVDTDALRRAADIGEFAIAATAPEPGGIAHRFLSPLGDLPELPTAAALVASSADAAYVAGLLHLRLARTPGQRLALTVDVTDPLGRSTHAVLDVPAQVPDPAPAVSLTASRAGGILRVRIMTNVPLPPDPGHEWTLEIRIQRVIQFPPLPPATRTFGVSTIPTVPAPGAMPDPAFDPAPFEIRRVDPTDLVLFWARTPVPVRVGVRLTSPAGESATATQVVP
jgi:hypothetical protein